MNQLKAFYTTSALSLLDSCSLSSELEQIDSWVLPVFTLYLPLFLVRRYLRPAFFCECGRRITFTAAR
jgi:hypothetical protein